MKAGLAETLSGVGPFTVFAPDNYAFARLPADLVATLNTDTELLKKVLLYHVVSGKVMSEDITNDAAVDTVEGTMALRTNVYLQSKFYDVSQVLHIDLAFLWLSSGLCNSQW